MRSARAHRAGTCCSRLAWNSSGVQVCLAALAKKVLIVDDTPSGLAFLRDVVTQPHLTVFEANSGRQAIEVHRRERVDLIIMDLQMPGMDGERVTRTIRGERALRDVSILLFSDRSRPGLRERCLAAGAN